MNAYEAYTAASQQHEMQYGVEPHPIVTTEQRAYLQEHKSELDWSQRESLNEAVVVGVSPASAPLGKEPEPDYSPSLADDFSL